MTKIITNLHNPLCKKYNYINNEVEIEKMDLIVGVAHLSCGCLIPIERIWKGK